MKNFGLALLVACIGLFAACSDDDDKTPNDNATAVAGTYKSSIVVTLPQTPAMDPTENDFTVTRTGNDLVTLELKDFKFGPADVGDIALTDVPVNKTSGGYAFTETTRTITPTELGLEVKVTVNGTVVGNKIIIDLVIAEVPGFTAPILVDIEGVKSGAKSTYADISSISFASDFVISQPSVSGTDLTLYIKEGTTADQLKAVVVTLAVSDKATVNPISGSKIDLSSGSAKFMVTAEDGVTKKEYTVTTKVSSLSFFDFEEWETFTASKLNFRNPIGWATSNAGTAMLYAFSEKWSITEETVDFFAGKTSAKLETVSTASRVALYPAITPASLFLGNFNLLMFDQLNSARFGIPVTKKPLEIKGYYKYKSGDIYYNCPNKSTKNVVIEVPNKKDECAIYAFVYEYDLVKAEADAKNNGHTSYITGKNLKDADGKFNSAIIAMASLADGTEKAAYTPLSLKLQYTKEFDKTKSYRMAFISSSSYDGDNFNGAPGSTLLLDNIEIISE